MEEWVMVFSVAFKCISLGKGYEILYMNLINFTF